MYRRPLLPDADNKNPFFVGLESWPNGQGIDHVRSSLAVNIFNCIREFWHVKNF